MNVRHAVALSAFTLIGACGPTKPETIAYDADQCNYCRMQISDPRFGAELLTRHGRSVKFDSIECLVAFYTQAVAANDVGSVWVSDFQHPGTLIEATHATFVDLGAGRAPMGRGWAAASTTDAAIKLRGSDARAVTHWGDLL
jgi:copper chaperone NosL